jgi:hypothetical protein
MDVEMDEDEKALYNNLQKLGEAKHNNAATFKSLA